MLPKLAFADVKLPAILKLINVPTLVMFGCAFVVTVPAVTAVVAFTAFTASLEYVA